MIDRTQVNGRCFCCREFYSTRNLLKLTSSLLSLNDTLLSLFVMLNSIFSRNLFGTLLSLQPQIPSAGHGESREEKVAKSDLLI